MPVSAQPASRFFHEFFPPPKFLEMPAVGLDISDRAVTALELVRKHGAFVVGRFVRRPLPHGVIAGGYVHDKERVSAELRHLKEELHLSFVGGSLPEEKAYIYTTKVPHVSPHEMRGAIQFTLEENVPLSPAEVLFDYAVVPSASSSDDSAEVSVTVLPRTVVSTYVDLFHSVGLIPLSFELGAQAICRAVIPLGRRGTSLVANVGEEKTGLFIARDGVVYFTATVAIGSSAIAKPPAADTSPAELVAALRDEIGKHLTYWQTHAGSAAEGNGAVGGIILCGRAAALPGFGDSLSRSLALPVIAANVWRNVCSLDQYIPPILYEDSLEYAAAVGLALPKSY